MPGKHVSSQIERQSPFCVPIRGPDPTPIDSGGRPSNAKPLAESTPRYEHPQPSTVLDRRGNS